MPEGASRLPARQIAGVTPAAVLFDCDGVLADTEGLVNRLVASELTARGWPMDEAAARQAFLGMAWPDMRPLVEARTGALPPEWEDTFSRRITALLTTETLPIPGAIEALRLVAARLPVAIASNSSRRELTIKLQRLGLVEVFGARRFSFEDVPRAKPAPDIYRAAAAACGAAPADCVVVEDSLAGIRAGLAAGCRVLGFARDTPAAVLMQAGATPFTDMATLPALLGLC